MIPQLRAGAFPLPIPDPRCQNEGIALPWTPPLAALWITFIF
ncbi:hypothetical protein MC7420_5338 [Coleofasciculus chthonoplastes PCC 7420]|uniref:Uncharacterized protein n=1 Tax=Coleofasciculus chthonoplastes PCC 7420 TaxID=118168 RepID=B4VP98_9CYAN|nr:hypothetical protein MC7420_5338 [Coleofasciculus chthonoplastes PCC 7420]